MIRLFIGAGGSAAPCQSCRTVETPRGWFYWHDGDTGEVVLCVRCLADAVDEATGWRFRRNVDTGLQARAFQVARIAANPPRPRGRPRKVRPE